MREQLECIKSIWERLVFDANATGAVIIIPIKEKILAAIALEHFWSTSNKSWLYSKMFHKEPSQHVQFSSWMCSFKALLQAKSRELTGDFISN